MVDDPTNDVPELQRKDAAARAADLARMAEQHADATFGTTDASRAVVPGVISGDLGVKGVVSAQLRDVSRVARSRGEEVPPGTVASNGMRLVLLPMLAIVVVLIAIVALIMWWAW